MSINSDIQSLEPGNKITLFELDASSINADRLFFHSHLQSNPIYWQGKQYDPWPIECEGFARSTSASPQPKLRVGNVDGTITALCLAFDDLVGARLIRRQTLVQYLDSKNFPQPNPTADPNEHFPDEIWYIERKSAENDAVVEFELTTAADLNGQQLPGRQIIANACTWILRGGYRGPYCGYNGPPVADINDAPTRDPSKDVCGGRVRSCKMRFGLDSPIPYGSFPASSLIRN